MPAICTYSGWTWARSGGRRDGHRGNHEDSRTLAGCMTRLRAPVADFVVGLPRRLRDPVSHTDLLQVTKTVGAAVLAWVIAVHVFSLEQPFLAPWAALLTVHASVYRTLSR